MECQFAVKTAFANLTHIFQTQSLGRNGFKTRLNEKPGNHAPGFKNLKSSTIIRKFHIINRNSILLPLDGSRWLGGNIVDYAIHAFYPIDDLVGDFTQKLVG